MFIEHDPQIPSRQERRKVSEESCSDFILISASSTIGPQRIEVDLERIVMRVGGDIGIVAVDLEILDPLGFLARLCGPCRSA